MKSNPYQMALEYPEESLYVNEFEIVERNDRRWIREASEPGVQIGGPESAAYYLYNNIFADFDSFKQEELWTLMLNTKGEVTHESLIYRGTIDSAPARMAELFRPAVLCNAAGIVLAHNHPSGSSEPSPQDIRATEAMELAGNLLGIMVLDHLVLGKDSFVSMRGRGVGFKT